MDPSTASRKKLCWELRNMTKIALTLISIFFSVSALAQGTSNLGKQIQFYQENGVPKFNVQISRDVGPGVYRSWAIKFTVNGQELSEGQPVRKVAWRLWDKRSQSFINYWRVQIETPNDMTFSGPTEFYFETGEPGVVNEAVQNSSQLVLVIYAGIGGNLNDGQAVLTTHFIDLSSHCSTNGDQFLDITVNKTGCGTLPKPAQPVELPSANGKVADLSGSAGNYCEGVAKLNEDIQKISEPSPLGIKGTIAREMKLSKVLCNTKGEFVGYKDIKDKNIRAIVNAASATQGLGRLWAITKEFNLSSQGMMIAYRMQLDQEKKIFYNDSLVTAYPEIYGELRDAYSALENWAEDLNNYYRSL